MEELDDGVFEEAMEVEVLQSEIGGLRFALLNARYDHRSPIGAVLLIRYAASPQSSIAGRRNRHRLLLKASKMKYDAYAHSFLTVELVELVVAVTGRRQRHPIRQKIVSRP